METRLTKNLNKTLSTNAANQEALEHIEKLETGFLLCKVCGKVSKDRSNMKKHVETHIDGLSYSCQICYMEFRSKNMLYLHNKTHKF